MRVKDATAFSEDFDLLINDTYKMKVVNYEKGLSLGSLEDQNFDILAVVYKGEINSTVFYMKTGKEFNEIKFELLTIEVLKKHFTKKIKTII